MDEKKQMREILFRGQTRRLGELVRMNGEKVPSKWVYGGICQGEGAFSIIYGWKDEEREAPIDKFVVYSNTVGQYTGLTDKNGKKIFEGDICKNTKTFEVVSVKWHGTMAGYVWSKRKENHQHLFDFGELFRAYDKYEVIGNIHDNPELLKGGAE